MQDLHRAAESEPRPVLLVATATTDEVESRFGKVWPEAPVVADEDGSIYSAFGLGLGKWRHIIGPVVWRAAWRALRSGARLGRVTGDVRLMSGYFIVDAAGKIVWSLRSSHAGDVNVLDRVPAPGSA